MKAYIQTSLLLFTLTFFSCKKEEKIVLDAGIINVTNAVIGGATITLKTDNPIISSNNTIGNNNSVFLPARSDSKGTVRLVVPAIAATATTPAIPEVVYFSQILEINSQKNYSLFLTGASPAAVESVLIDEHYTRTYNDSVCGVRIINLSMSANPISVNIQGSANGSEVSSLAYKAYNDFKQYPAKKVNPNYKFEFRDAVTGSMLASYTLVTPYFHNVTMAFRGKAGAYGVILNNDY